MAATFRYRRIAKTPHSQDDAARTQALTPTGVSAPPVYAIPDSATIHQGSKGKDATPAANEHGMGGLP